MAVAAAGSGTCFGFFTQTKSLLWIVHVALLLGSLLVSPWAFLPQHHTVPSILRTHVWAPAATTSTAHAVATASMVASAGASAASLPPGGASPDDSAPCSNRQAPPTPTKKTPSHRPTERGE